MAARRVIWLPSALRDLRNIFIYNAPDADQIDTAERFVAELVERTDRILSNSPEIGQLFRSKEFRQYLVHENYRVLYRPGPEVRIFAVVHVRQDLDSLLRRRQKK